MGLSAPEHALPDPLVGLSGSAATQRRAISMRRKQLAEDAAKHKLPSLLKPLAAPSLERVL